MPPESKTDRSMNTWQNIVSSYSNEHSSEAQHALINHDISTLNAQQIASINTVNNKQLIHQIPQNVIFKLNADQIKALFKLEPNSSITTLLLSEQILAIGLDPLLSLSKEEESLGKKIVSFISDLTFNDNARKQHDKISNQPSVRDWRHYTVNHPGSQSALRQLA